MSNRLPNDLLEKPLELPAPAGERPRFHVFEPRSITAINTALACGRPLLIRGEPGVGKSQLAEAAAVGLERMFMSVFVHARTEAHDLLWSYDAVTRLAAAQALTHGVGQAEAAKQLEQRRYVKPGPLWWALNWGRAEQQATDQDVVTKASVPKPSGKCHPKNGVVLLVDEIDKADSSVPNGLLECLGQRRFTVPGLEDDPVHAEEPSPLVVLTTNEDRVLPDAFVRRCVVLHLRVPDPEQWQVEGEDAEFFENWLFARGRDNFGELGEVVLRKAAQQVIADRKKVRDAGYCPPGLAEYMDLLAALAEIGAEDAANQIEQIGEFLLYKHADPTPRRDDYRYGRGG